MIEILDVTTIKEPDNYNLKEWALYYAKIGLKIFRLAPRCKVPTGGSNGFYEATDDLDQIEKWWNENPNYNIGLATGKEFSRVSSIDLDEDEIKDKHGLRVLADWEKDNGELTETWRVITGRGGNQYFYRYNGSFKSDSDICKGVDTRGDGGYSVLPPSIHPNGNRYEWECGYSPSEIALADMGQQEFKFLKYCTEKGATEKNKGNGNGKENPTVVEEDIPEGARVTTLIRLAGSLRKKGLSWDSVIAVLNIENEKRCKPKLPQKEMDTQVLTVVKRDWDIIDSYTTDNNTPPNGSVEMPPVVRGSEIDLTAIEEIEFIIKGLLSPGLALLASDPKFGKSWFALLMCLSLAEGKNFLGYETKPTACLYLALEDGDIRVKNRLKKLHGTAPIPDRFSYVTEKVEDLSSGIMQQLELMYNQNPSLKLIVIDTLQCIRGKYSNKDGGAYGYDYKEMNTLKKFAKEHDLAILLLHHTSKCDNPNDPFFSISGTRGITGALDLMMVMKKESALDKQARLYIRGRDIEDDAFVIELDNCKWKKVGSLEEMEEEKARKEYYNLPIVQVIRALMECKPEWQGRMSNLIEEGAKLGVDIPESPQALSNKIKKLEEELYIRDKISHGVIPKGSGSAIHVFKKLKTNLQV